MEDLRNNMCDAGYVCNEGSDVPNPDGVTDPGMGTPCASGYQCPGLVIHQMECPDGFRTTESAQATCQPCDLGYFCNKNEDVIN